MDTKIAYSKFTSALNVYIKIIVAKWLPIPVK